MRGLARAGSKMRRQKDRETRQKTAVCCVILLNFLKILFKLNLVP
jgi:hypothetical protein